MGTLKKLAGQTAIYGLSSIVARIVNFFLVPLYTRVLPTGSYGRASELLAYVALLQVVLIFGLETGFFRFANKHREKSELIFSTSVLFILSSSLFFLLLVILFAGELGAVMGYPSLVLVYIALVLAIDSFTAVMFTKLRYDNKAWQFAIFRSLKIFSEVFFNLVFFLLLPSYFKAHPSSFLLTFLPATPDYTYIIFAILMSCLVSLLLFVPHMLRTAFRFSKDLLRELLKYSFPLMIAGLPGVANDFMSRLLFRFFAPSTTPWDAQLGIFNANIKLAVFMVLFVQMFRYAAEPFFFASAHKEDMKSSYADVMKYFVAFCMFIFLLVALFTDVFALFIGRDYREGIGVLPIMLIANVLLGVNFNLSMWYKLSEQTRYAVYVTLTGLAITFVTSVLFMPAYGYYAAAWGYLLSYLVMVVMNALLGKKYYPIPYDWKSILLYFISGLCVYAAFLAIYPGNLLVRMALGALLLVLFVLFVFRKEKVSVVAVVRNIPRMLRIKKRASSYES